MKISPPSTTAKDTNPRMTFDALFGFYYDYLKPLYGSVQTDGCLPTETLFEINAAFDHLSRIWKYKEPEAEAILKTYGHLKRSCLDIFKLKVKRTLDEYRELISSCEINYIDNGDYRKNLNILWSTIQEDAACARSNEGAIISRKGELEDAFPEWQAVYEKCVKFHHEFYLHPAINWAKKQSFGVRLKKVWGWLLSLFVAFLLGLATNYAYDHFFKNNKPVPVQKTFPNSINEQFKQ